MDLREKIMLVNLKFLAITSYKEKVFKAISAVDLTIHSFLIRIRSSFLSFFEINCDYRLETKFLAKKDEREFEYTLKSDRSILNESEGLFAFNCLLSVFTRGIYKKDNQEGIFVDTPEHGEVKIIRPISIKIILYKRQIPTDSGETISREKFFSTVNSFGYKVNDIDNNTEESVDKLNNYLDSIRKFK